MPKELKKKNFDKGTVVQYPLSKDLDGYKFMAELKTAEYNGWGMTKRLMEPLTSEQDFDLFYIQACKHLGIY